MDKKCERGYGCPNPATEVLFFANGQEWNLCARHAAHVVADRALRPVKA